MKNKKILKISVIILLVGGGIFWFKFAAKKKQLPTVQENFITVTVIKAKNKNLENESIFNGLIIPKEILVISTELSEVRIKKIMVNVGAEIKKGHKLAEIDRSILQNDLSEAKAEYDLAKDEFEKADIIRDSGAISQNFYAEKLKKYQIAEAKLQKAKINLQRTIITSPFSGIIYDKKIEVGSPVNSGQALFQIIKDKKLELEAQVPEAMLYKIKIGAPAIVEVIGFENPIHGKVRYISPNIDSDSRTGAVRISLENCGREFAVGTFAQAKIITDRQFGKVIPILSILKDEEGDYIYVTDKDGKVKRYNIEIRFRSQDEALITGIDDQAQIIAKAASFVKEGDIVKIKTENN